MVTVSDGHGHITRHGVQVFVSHWHVTSSNRWFEQAQLERQRSLNVTERGDSDAGNLKLETGPVTVVGVASVNVTRRTSHWHGPEPVTVTTELELDRT
jgi:hypothetical protein